MFLKLWKLSPYESKAQMLVEVYTCNLNHYSINLGLNSKAANFSVVVLYAVRLPLVVLDNSSYTVNYSSYVVNCCNYAVDSSYWLIQTFGLVIDLSNIKINPISLVSITMLFF